MDIVTQNPCGFAITDDEFPPLLTLIDRLARTRASDTALVEEYRDAGRDGLLSAWQSWQGQVPFRIFAELCIARRMRGAVREYRRWHYPVGPTPSPDAEACVQRRAWEGDDEDGTRVLTCDPLEPTGWLVRDVARHWPCLSPTLQRALCDFLMDQAYATIAARDGVRVSTVSSRHTNLLIVLRRHLGARDTSCREEEGSWKKNLGEPIAMPTPHRTRKNTVQRAYRLRRKMAHAALACAD